MYSQRLLLTAETTPLKIEVVLVVHGEDFFKKPDRCLYLHVIPMEDGGWLVEWKFFEGFFASASFFTSSTIPTHQHPHLKKLWRELSTAIRDKVYAAFEEVGLYFPPWEEAYVTPDPLGGRRDLETLCDRIFSKVVDKLRSFLSSSEIVKKVKEEGKVIVEVTVNVYMDEVDEGEMFTKEDLGRFFEKRGGVDRLTVNDWIILVKFIPWEDSSKDAQQLLGYLLRAMEEGFPIYTETSQ